MWQMEQSEERRGSMVQVLSEHGRCNLCLKLIQETQFPKRVLCLIVVVAVAVQERYCFVVINIYRHPIITALPL
jgi:hypothetical protein